MKLLQYWPSLAQQRPTLRCICLVLSLGGLNPDESWKLVQYEPNTLLEIEVCYVTGEVGQCHDLSSMSQRQVCA